MLNDMIKWNTDLGVDRLEKEKSVHLCRMKVWKITLSWYTYKCGFLFFFISIKPRLVCAGAKFRSNRIAIWKSFAACSALEENNFNYKLFPKELHVYEKLSCVPSDTWKSTKMNNQIFLTYSDSAYSVYHRYVNNS